MSKKKRNIPELRFPEFSGEWKSQRMSDVVVINQGLQIAISERLTTHVSGAYFYITNEFLKENSEKKYYVVNPPKSVICTKEDVLMTRTGNTGVVVTNVEGVFHNNFFKISYPNYIDRIYLFNFLKLERTQTTIVKLAGTSTIPDLNHSDFYKILIVYPTLPEQKKIANFLTAIDGRLQTLKKKKSLLEQYKKGVMQKIFSQELRFKDDKGKNFPKWESRELGTCLDYEQPTNYIVTSTDYNDSYGTPVLTAGKSFILGYTNENKGIFDKNLPVIIFDDFTTSAHFVSFPFKVKSSAIKILTSKENFNIKFIYEAMQMIKYEIGGHERHWISKFAPLSIQVPSLPEQKKIADFLSSIDDKIDHCNKEIEKTELYKKGLLQKMFV